MTKRTWWLHIQRTYPLALTDCLHWFQQNSRQFWRSDLQQPEKLVQYFAACYISIDIRRLEKKNQWHYGYKVSDATTTIIKGTVFPNPTLAYPDAFDLAFRCREQFLQQRKTPTAPKSRQRKNLHQRRKEPGIKVLLQKGDILYPIPSSDGHAISEDEIRAIRETATVLRVGKRLGVAELLVAYKLFLEGEY